MYCPNCGRQSEGKFCPECGARLEGGENAAPVTQSAPLKPPPAPNPGGTQPGYIPAQGYNPGNQDWGSYRIPPKGHGYAQVPNRGPLPADGPMAAAPNAETPARALARRLAGSPLFLAVCLLTSVIGVLSVVSILQGQQVSAGLSSGVRPASHPGLAYFSAALMLVIYGLLAGGMWISYATAVRGDRPMRSAGLTMVKAVLVTFLVFIILALVGMALMVLVILVDADGAGFARAEAEFQEGIQQFFRVQGIQLPASAISLRGVIAAVMIMGTLALGICILWCAKAIKTVNIVKYVVQSGNPDDRVSMLVLVFCVLSAVFGAVTMTRALVQGQLLPALSSALAVGYELCLALLLYRWRDGMQALGVYKGLLQQRPMQ